jgi:flagellar biosynthetic protein FlhB
MAEDLGERTEEPTPRRRADARREGNVARSQDLSGALMLLAATVAAAAAMYPALGALKEMMEAALASGAGTTGQAIQAAREAAAAGARICLPIMLAFAAVAFLVQFVQVGWVFAPSVLSPKLGHLDPMRGFQRLLGINGLVRAALSVAKVAVVGAVAALTVYQYRLDIVALAYLAPMQCLSRGGLMALDLALRLLAVLLVLGVIDLLYQRWKHHRDLRMTRQQVRDELKSAEGDPQVKRRRFRMQQQIAMQRINASVPRADVVVTNPEHVAVALRYDAERMRAPTVVAKGADLVALRIRQIALLNDVPIVQRPPLARTLYRQVAVGQEVPPDFYHAVAEVLAYVYQLSGRKAG